MVEMAKKYLGEKAVFNRLEKYYQAEFTEAQKDVAAFYGDLEGDLEWGWKFDLEGQTHTLIIDRYTGKIEHTIK
jgi:hypothetical protein